jgi:hypothetical protein
LLVASEQDEKVTHRTEPTDQIVVEAPSECSTRFAIFDECPLCGGALSAEHAHFRCTSCGWRDSCCD